MRAATWGPVVHGETSVLVGTTKNCILQAVFNEKVDYLTKVNAVVLSSRDGSM